jgi:hypothetical protein
VQNQGTVALKKSPFRHAVGHSGHSSKAGGAQEKGKKGLFHRFTKV